MCYNKKIKKQTGSDHSYFIGKRHIMYMKKTDQGEQKRTLYIQTLGTMRLTSGDEIISLHTSITCLLYTSPAQHWSAAAAAGAVFMRTAKKRTVIICIIFCVFLSRTDISVLRTCRSFLRRTAVENGII